MSENRFKKSIENATDNTQENIPEITVENIQQNTVENTSDNILKKILENGRKNRGKNHTIYLSGEVGEALAKCSEKAKKSKSELVDSILREVFKLEK
jgi:hypothetical protein